MKTKAVLVATLIGFFITQVSAQDTLLLQPGATAGKDAKIWSNGANNNYASAESITAYTWTHRGNKAVKRFFMEFDYSSIPSDAIITSASLSLYYNPSDIYESFDYHSGTNDILIERVTGAWAENTLTWNNQPASTSTNRVSLAPSTSKTQDYTNIDVTQMVSDMVSQGNHGFLVRMKDEAYPYRSVLFASSDHTNSSLHPKLEIIYTRSTNCTTIKPNSTQGKDAKVWSNGANNNYANAGSITAYTWTNSGKTAVKRFFIEFDYSSIPSDAIITSASLSLYYNPSDIYESFDYHSGTNDILIERVTGAWAESTLTWNNQPASTSTNRVSLAPSISKTQNYMDIDVTQLVMDMASQGNHGFLIKMKDEANPYRSVLFASSDHADDRLHPEIKICWKRDTTTMDIQKASAVDFQIYPNPSNGTFNLLLSDFDVSGLDIFDMTGKRVSNYELDGNKVQLHDKGLFIIKVYDRAGRSAVKRVIIQ